MYSAATGTSRAATVTTETPGGGVTAAGFSPPQPAARMVPRRRRPLPLLARSPVDRCWISRTTAIVPSGASRPPAASGPCTNRRPRTAWRWLGLRHCLREDRPGGQEGGDPRPGLNTFPSPAWRPSERAGMEPSVPSASRAELSPVAEPGPAVRGRSRAGAPSPSAATAGSTRDRRGTPSPGRENRDSAALPQGNSCRRSAVVSEQTRGFCHAFLGADEVSTRPDFRNRSAAHWIG